MDQEENAIGGDHIRYVSTPLTRPRGKSGSLPSDQAHIMPKRLVCNHSSTGPTAAAEGTRAPEGFTTAQAGLLGALPILETVRRGATATVDCTSEAAMQTCFGTTRFPLPLLNQPGLFKPSNAHMVWPVKPVVKAHVPNSNVPFKRHTREQKKIITAMEISHSAEASSSSEEQLAPKRSGYTDPAPGIHAFEWTPEEWPWSSTPRFLWKKHSTWETRKTPRAPPAIKWW